MPVRATVRWVIVYRRQQEAGLRRRRYGIDDAVNDFAKGFTRGVIAFLVVLGLGVLLLVGVWLWPV